MKNDVLVVGGAGFIGSHMVKCLARNGWSPVVLDDFSTGHRDAVRDCEVIAGSLALPSLLEGLFAHRQFAAVMHFAGSIQVSESVHDPAGYYRNNVVNSFNLLNAMRAQVNSRLVFSSSAAIFGEPEQERIAENHRRKPVNP